MPFEPIYKIYEPDGTTLIDTLPNLSAVPMRVITAASYSIGARKGVRGGRVLTVGDVRTPFAWGQDTIVVIEYTTGMRLYAGRVDGPSRTVEGQNHEYTLRSLWADLEGVVIDEKITLGTIDGAEASTGTVGAIIEWIHANLLADSVFSLGDHACTVAVESFILDPGADLGKRLEDLELIAGSDGQTWCAGITPDLELYFAPIPAVEDADPIEFTVGSAADPVFAGKQELIGRYVGNHLGLIGSIGETNDGSIRHFKIIFNQATGGDWAESIGQWGQKRIRYIAVPALGSDATMRKWAAGWLGRYGNPTLKLESMDKAHSGDLYTGTRPVFPWEARGLFTDTQGGEIGSDIISVIDYEISGAGFVSRATIGLQADESADYAPTRERDSIEDAVSTVVPFGEELPVATDVISPPADAPLEYPSPDAPGGGESPGPESMALTVIDLLPGSGWNAGDTIPCLVKLSPGTFTEAQLDVQVLFSQRDLALDEIDTDGIECALVGTDASGYQVWATVTGFTSAEEDSFLFVGATITADNAVDPETVIHYPTDIVTAPLNGMLLRLHLEGGGTNLNTFTITIGGLNDGG